MDYTNYRALLLVDLSANGKVIPSGVYRIGKTNQVSYRKADVCTLIMPDGSESGYVNFGEFNMNTCTLEDKKAWCIYKYTDYREVIESFQVDLLSEMLEESNFPISYSEFLNGCDSDTHYWKGFYSESEAFSYFVLDKFSKIPMPLSKRQRFMDYIPYPLNLNYRIESFLS